LKRSQKPVWRFVLWVGITVFLGVVGFAPKSIVVSPQVVTVPKGSSAYQVGDILKSAGLIWSKVAFHIHIRLSNQSESLRAGQFLLSPSQSIPSLIKTLQTQSGSYQRVKVTIPEDFDIWEIAKRLDTLGIAPYDEVVTYWHETAKSEFESEFQFLKDIPVNTLEGYLYPETYFVDKSNGLVQLTRQMLTQFQTKIIPLWDQNPGLMHSPKARFNFHQVLTIASLIQKEARIQTEMTTISAVFFNRLRQRMPLASDPTVVYAMGKSYKDRVFYKDTRIDSPYNTYKYSGFMPSPISCVSEIAFRAALSPENLPYLFFVAKPDGSHVFTQTYQEHLNVQR
jgi:UPF0755 protein